MNYNFIYDKGMVDKLAKGLTEEELYIVLATILGEHNAIF